MAASLLLFWAAAPARGQQEGEAPDLGQLYQRARAEALLERRARDTPGVAALPPEPLRTPRLDSLQAWLAPDATGRSEAGAASAPLPPIRDRFVIRRLTRPVFENRFADVRWAYLGANSRATIDTMQTRELRARLQAHYGDPTRTVVDAETLDDRRPSEYVQFEYWFILNDNRHAPEEAIPIKLVDTGGPFDRGLVFAAPARFQGRLRALRSAFFEPLLDASLRARYVDYYYDPDAGTWYRTGYDGQRFFVRPVPRREVLQGRRPTLQREP